MRPSTPDKLLVIRPDAYGDIVLFEPVLRVLRETWADTEITVLIQERYADLTPLLPTGIRWLTTKCDPYRTGPATNPPALDALRRKVTKFAPDCVVAACFDKTWLEAVVAAWTPKARQISLGPYELDMISRILLGKTVSIEWPDIYREIVSVDADSLEWDKNLRLARHLTGRKVAPLRPRLNVPEEARHQARKLLQTAALKSGNFVACCPAGVSKVSIKAWPAERYGEVLAWLEKKHGHRALLVGHENEREILIAVQSAARAHGARPAIWKGQDGQIAVLAALLQQSQFYFGNDTGALHLAAALDRPVVSIFGGGTWPRFKPVAQRSVSVVQPLPCFGCGWDCSFGDGPCIKTIPMAPVQQAIDHVLAETDEMHQDIVVEDGLTAAQQELIASVAATTKQNRHVRIRTGPKATELLSRHALDDLIEQLQFSEADRAARLGVIQQQGQRATELEAEVHRWLEESKRLSAQAQQSENTRAELTGQASRLLEENQQATARLRALQIELEGKRIENESLAHEKLDRLGQLDKTRCDLAAAEADRTRLSADIVKYADDLARLQTELEQRRIENESLAHEKLDLLGQLDKARHELAAAEADRTRLSAVVTKYTDDLARLQTELERRRIENESRAREKLDLLGQLDKTRHNLAASEADRTRMSAAIAKYTDDLARLQAELERQRNAYESLSREMQLAKDENRSLAARLDAQSRALDGAVKSLESARTRIRELQARISEIDGHLLVRVLKVCRLWPF